MDKTTLRIQALTESIGDLVKSYESRIADLRAELTLVTNERNSLLGENEELRGNSATDEDSQK